MISIFGIDLSQPPAPRRSHGGPARGAAAGALIAAIVDHFGFDHSYVEATIAGFLPGALPKLASREGWALFGSFFGVEAPDAPPFAATLH